MRNGTGAKLSKCMSANGESNTCMCTLGTLCSLLRCFVLPLTCFVGVRVQQDPAGFLQIPLAALQKFFTLGSGAQAETEQLLHLQHAAGGGAGRAPCLFINIIAEFAFQM